MQWPSDPHVFSPIWSHGTSSSVEVERSRRLFPIGVMSRTRRGLSGTVEGTAAAKDASKTEQKSVLEIIAERDGKRMAGRQD